MSSIPNVQVRRATIEDLPKLIELWRQERLTPADLEKRFKEFQVAAAPDGEVLGAVGLQVAGKEGFLHSEVFSRFDLAETLRDQLWQRVQVIARNFGLVRVWTQFATPFWRQTLRPATPEELAKLPAAFAALAQPWLVAQLREESTLPGIDQEFALFREAERERTEK